ncbi:cyclin-Q-like, partial [Neopelma chrysocephalum]|uniref:cyclin-Q-like n=1 Tax=Neopelma chrysocephalum TaxID=114329 RepID=UPI000FCD1786
MKSPPRPVTSRRALEPLGGGAAEARARFRIARFIMEAGVKLGLGSAALATACGSFHAFAAAVATPGPPQDPPRDPQDPPRDPQAPPLDQHLVAAAALFVAAKAQGTPRRARDVLNVTLRYLGPPKTHPGG